MKRLMFLVPIVTLITLGCWYITTGLDVIPVDGGGRWFALYALALFGVFAWVVSVISA